MKYVIVKLTQKEAAALATAADNSIGGAADEQDRIAVLGDEQAIRCGIRALEKLNKAINESSH
jgi:hypothetical protein